jgi:hypothetical protein
MLKDSDIENTVTEQSTVKPRGPYKVKSPSRGGPRPNAGRKPGSKQKISALQLLDAVQTVTGKEFAMLVAEQLQAAIISKDNRLVKDYLDMIGKKAIADLQETDITSGGEALAAQFSFVPAELSDWAAKK